MAEARIIIESWRRFYNTLRPHGSLGYKPPAPEVFIPAIARGGCATPTGFAARAGADTVNALTIYPDHPMGADQTVSWGIGKSSARSNLQAPRV
jgi:hypothetical protein